jgi:hypothetical protein
LCLSGCIAPRDGQVRLDAVEPDLAEHHELAPEQDFLVGPIVGETLLLPAYPADALRERRESVRLCMEIEVDETGTVIDSRPLPASSRCDEGSDRDLDAFVEVTRKVLAKWRFYPSLICTLAEVAQQDGSCEGALFVEAVPMLRAYRFLFIQGPGGPRVSLEDG